MQERNQFDQNIGVAVKNWQPAARPSNTIIKGNYCIIEPLMIEKHTSKLLTSLLVDNKGELWTYLPYGPFYTVAEYNAWIVAALKEEDVMLYAILDVKTQLPVGLAGFLRINPEHGVIEIGHLQYSKLLQKTRAATEAMYLMMNYAFETLGYRRYEWKCHSLNLASRNAALRLGFSFEGIFRQSHVIKNYNRDTAWFSIIDSEWSEIKKRFQCWLSPDNFDVNGKQIMKLEACLSSI